MDVAGVVLCLSTLLHAAEPDAAALLKRYDDVMGPAAFAATVVMVAHREDGTTRTYKMKVLKSGADKFRATFQEPSSARGQEMLRNGENLWLYLPSLKRPTRMPSRENFMGGDFNNADVLRSSYTADYVATLVPSTLPKTSLLDLKARGPQVAYDHIKLWFTQDAEPLPLQAEYYTQSGILLRSAQFSDVKVVGKLRRPSHVVMRNEQAKARWSEMSWEDLELKDSISPQRFVLDDLGK